MADITFNSEGIPLMIAGRSFMGSTSGAPDKPVRTSKLTVEHVDGTETLNSVEFASWGAANDFPQKADELIEGSTVLKTGLKYKYLFTIGQGLMAVKLKGIDGTGNEIFEPYPDDKVRRFVEGRIVRNYYEKATRDYFRYGIGGAQLIADHGMGKLVGLSGMDMKYCRLSEMKNGEIQNLIISGGFPYSLGSDNYEMLPVLSDYDPDGSLLRHMARRGKDRFAYMIRDNFSGNVIYALPDWWSAKQAGWLDVTKKVAPFLLKAYDNSMYIKWHIQIPYRYWDKKYPLSDFKGDVKAREAAIQIFMDSFESSLVSTENAHKAIFSMYETINGKEEEKWIITPLNTKSNFDKELATSAAGNSEILFSLMVNPSVMGAGMPGGPYSGNSGSGSDIREAFLVNIALAWLDRQKLNDPISLYLNFNGVEDVVIKSRNTLLTTLDTGGGTKKILS